METLKCTDKLSGIEFGSRLGELMLSPQVKEKFATVKEVHNEIELLGCLKSVVQPDNERALNLLHDLSFHYHS